MRKLALSRTLIVGQRRCRNPTHIVCVVPDSISKKKKERERDLDPVSEYSSKIQGADLGRDKSRASSK